MRQREKRPTIKRVPATEARIHFGEMLKRVYRDREHVVIEKDGLPVATLLSHSDYEEYRRLLALQQFENLNRELNREARALGLTEEQTLADLEVAKNRVFEEQYGRAVRNRKCKAS
jgi:prevent-host-death family protein